MLVPRYVAAAIVGVRLRRIDADCQFYINHPRPAFVVERGGTGPGRLHGLWVDPIGYARYRNSLSEDVAIRLVLDCYLFCGIVVSNAVLRSTERIASIRTPIRRQVDEWVRVCRGPLLAEITRAAVARHDAAEVRVDAPAVATAVAMVGADPEFEIMLNGRMASAYNYFPRRTDAQVGCDGMASTGELRPSPGSPDQVFNNVRALLRRVHTRLSNEGGNFEVRAGAGVHTPLGGHIHLSASRLSPGQRNRLHLLDVYVSEHLARYSNPDNPRRASGYGHPSELRQQPHGWEYRTPCSWLAHPTLAKGALLATYLVAKAEYVPSDQVGIVALAENSQQRQDLEAFYQFEMPAGARYLEDLDVMETWGFGKILASQVEATPADVQVAHVSTRHQISYNADDYNLSEICLGVTTRLDLTVMGAREDRAPGLLAIFLPGDLFETVLGHPISLSSPINLLLAHWVGPEARIVFLSHYLRRTPELARQALTTMIEHFEEAEG